MPARVSVRSIHVFILCMLLASVAAGARTIVVPTDAATIQAGIGMAADKDTVLVLAGTYVENIDFGGKGICVMSAAGPDETWIAPSDSPDGSTVTFHQGEGRASCIEGFTIAHQTPAYGDNRGIEIVDASPTIRGNTIRSNSLIYASVTRGAGIYAVGVSSPLIEDNRILSNQAGSFDDMGHGFGGGIYLVANGTLPIQARIEGNAIQSNRAAGCTEGGSSGYGGGIYVEVQAPEECLILDNQVLSNSATGSHGGGGGIHANCLVEGNLIRGNRCDGAGGGLYLDGAGATAQGNQILSNRATVRTSMEQGIYGNEGGGVISYGRLIGNVIADNQLDLTGTYSDAPWSNGGGVLCKAGSVLEGNTIHRNRIVVSLPYQSASGAGAYLETSSIVAHNNIVSENGFEGDPGGVGGICNFGPEGVACNDVWNNDDTPYHGTDLTGTAGNIAVDPLLCDPDNGDYTLQEESPCAEENSLTCGQIGALPVDCGISAAPEAGTPETTLWTRCFPNPTHGAATILYEIPQGTRGNASVEILDLQGRLLLRLSEGAAEPGRHLLRWDGRDAEGEGLGSGAYFYRVVCGAHCSSGRLLIIE